MFLSICPPAFFRCLSNSVTYTELRITSFIESPRVTCSDNWVQVLSIPVLANGIRKGDPCGFNKAGSSNFCKRSWVRQTTEEGWRTYHPKPCGNNNKDEHNSPKTLKDKNHQSSSQKFRQLIHVILVILLITGRAFISYNSDPDYVMITCYI